MSHVYSNTLSARRLEATTEFGGVYLLCQRKSNMLQKLLEIVYFKVFIIQEKISGFLVQGKMSYLYSKGGKCTFHPAGKFMKHMI